MEVRAPDARGLDTWAHDLASSAGIIIDAMLADIDPVGPQASQDTDLSACLRQRLNRLPGWVGVKLTCNTATPRRGNGKPIDSIIT